MSAPAAPKHRPAAAGTATVLSLAFVAVAVVAVRDLSVSQGWIKGSTWTGSAVDGLDGLKASTALVVLGVVLVVVGLWWVVLAVKPAAPSHRPTHLDTDVWVTRSALSAGAVTAAEATPGVAVATARTGRRRVVVNVQTDQPDVADSVATRVRHHLEGFSDLPVKVTTEKVKHDS